MKRPQKKTDYHYSKQARAFVLCAGFVALLTGLSVRLIHLQHTLHAEVLEKMKEGAFLKEVVPARRGDILDRDRRPLATSEPVSDLVLDKYRIPPVDAIHQMTERRLGFSKEELKGLSQEKSTRLYYRMLASALSRPLKRDAEELLERLLEKPKELIVEKDLDSQVARELVRGLEEQGFVGLRFRDSMERAYVSGDLACHVLGYVYHDLKGASGIEASMDAFLQGTDGARYYDLENRLRDERFPTHGRHVVLTIDAAFQDLAERTVNKHFAALRPQAMSVIFAEPSTGEILALVNRPGFNPAEGGNVEPRHRWNTAIASIYEPGSMFKIVTHGAALDQGLVSLASRVSCHNGSYWEEGWKKPLLDASRGRASASVREVIAYSLNTGTFMVAQQMKPSSFYKYMASFGLGRKTGIRLPAEAKGTLPPPAVWAQNRSALARLAIGYTLNASPLQILGLMNVVCNDGNLVRPCIVRHILTEDYQKVSARLESEVVQRVISSRTAAQLKNALIHAVEGGTGRRAQVEGYLVGGKTGTTVKLIDGRYQNNRNIASFVGFIGTAEEPVLMGIVVVDDPQNEGKRYGGTVAAPIFKEIAEAGMYHFGVSRLAAVTREPNH